MCHESTLFSIVLRFQYHGTKLTKGIILIENTINLELTQFFNTSLWRHYDSVQYVSSTVAAVLGTIICSLYLKFTTLISYGVVVYSHIGEVFEGNAIFKQ